MGTASDSLNQSRFPNALVLLLGGILLAALLTHLLPAGEYQRRDDPVTGRKIVVAGTFAGVEPRPVSLFDAFVAIPKGLANAADVIFMTILAGGAFAVVDATGALREGIGWLIRKLGRREALIIPIVCLFFAAGGVLENMQEEIIALVPVLLLLTRSLGYDPLTAVAISIGASTAGAAFSPINPFQVAIAQKLAQLPLLSGSGFRVAVLLVALTVYIIWTMRYARRSRVPAPGAISPNAPEPPVENVVFGSLSDRSVLVLMIVLLTFAFFIYGVLRLHWDFEHMGALFFVMGLVAGIVGRLGIVAVIGFAQAIFVVLEQGRIVDTIVHGLVTPLAQLPVAASALGMIAMHLVVHVPVPSVSGQAILTMPVLVPLSDLLGLSRQVTVLAYQYGAGLGDLLTPTNGALMAVIAAAGARYEEWVKFVLPVLGLLLALGAGAVLVAIGIGLR